MELSSNQEAEIPMPLNSAYGGVHSHGHHGHLTHHHHHHFNQGPNPPPPPSHGHDRDHDHDRDHLVIPSTNINIPNINIVDNNDDDNNNNNNNNNGISTLTLEEERDQDQGKSTSDDRDCNPYSKSVVVTARASKKEVGVVVRYRECQKNHAASMGGNATDGCGEFMPSGEDGSFEALICSACNCHRNFHRKEIEGGHHHEDQYPSHSHHFYHPTPHHLLGSRARKVISGSNQGFLGYPTTGALIPAGTHVTRAIPINMPYQVGPSSDQSDDHDHDHHHHHHHGNGGGVMVRPPHQLVKKRFRTKFSQEQKEKMLGFAEKVGWKIQKQEESVVQQFCQEVGVKRRVLKVWMHNNKHTFANKNNNNNTNTSTTTNNNNNNNSLLN